MTVSSPSPPPSRSLDATTRPAVLRLVSIHGSTVDAAPRPAGGADLDHEIRRRLPVPTSCQPALADAVRYVLEQPGSLSRARLCRELMRAHGVAGESALDVAAAIEFFHIASLVLDDLPCMDDAALRRGRPCLHHRHGEATTILTALALINRAYELLWSALAPLPTTRSAAAARLVGECLGLEGVLSGQARDLAPAPEGRSVEEICEVADGKTGALFRLCLELVGWIVGSERLDELHALALVWGRLYQGLDDCKDRLLDSASSGKTTQRDAELQRPNLAAALDWRATWQHLDELSRRSAELVRQLIDDDPAWGVLQALSNRLEGQASDLRDRMPRDSDRQNCETSDDVPARNCPPELAAFAGP